MAQYLFVIVVMLLASNFAYSFIYILCNKIGIFFYAPLIVQQQKQKARELDKSSIIFHTKKLLFTY